MFFILSLLVPVLEGCDRISSSNKNVVKKDLTRILKNKELKCSSDTNQEIETFRHHWKKIREDIPNSILKIVGRTFN
ncbi:hypothetical protein LEP1GSC083_2421 [Leptospira interrogans serovar Pyrogenes str. L0374]|uniref:Uncharacterized protein n=1 Tax=Leptospira interrogans serovar Pyrogenes str. L0374 TaxID=1049928 RepID=M6KD15_LEPIR|nr:hypothetical protein LEP1GSC083_2421 [Leptospira interrogans serovar Pyrogenes str. L0374]